MHANILNGSRRLEMRIPHSINSPTEEKQTHCFEVDVYVGLDFSSSSQFSVAGDKTVLYSFCGTSSEYEKQIRIAVYCYSTDKLVIKSKALKKSSTIFHLQALLLIYTSIYENLDCMFLDRILAD